MRDCPRRREVGKVPAEGIQPVATEDRKMDEELSTVVNKEREEEKESSPRTPLKEKEEEKETPPPPPVAPPRAGAHARLLAAAAARCLGTPPWTRRSAGALPASEASRTPN